MSKNFSIIYFKIVGDVLIRDWDIGQIWEILDNLNYINEENVRESRHAMTSFSKRSSLLNREIIYDSLINKKPVSLSKTSHDTFKVIYEHPSRTSQDLYLILQFDEMENILIVTVYTNSIERRVRHHAR
ncbi:hypothetical protein HYG87_06590 [Methanobacterium alkalithermotolerans]|uniref:Uncharacterized protein n=1 Tax=Methanobacterium alkalithermotolerans TaxID=2731220 RepID=A0A8T8K9C5_9EURY|nr:hypothetical protein [Methanobacterium alkalithermotolerans]QUH23450.1 hypothetical protein HYG87_06590 [Methanobacterium alkalithermotolerans]